jgi:hypothetical protein
MAHVDELAGREDRRDDGHAAVVPAVPVASEAGRYDAFVSYARADAAGDDGIRAPVGRLRDALHEKGRYCCFRGLGERFVAGRM